jgi:hypothetical protein
MRRLATIAIATILLAAGCGDPSPDESAAPIGPGITCIGIPASTCSQAMEGVRSNGSRVPPVAIRVTCTARVCNESDGAVSVEVVYADGSRSSSGFGWSAAGKPVQVPGPPVLTVVPVCIRLDQEHCRSMAENAQGGRRFPPPIRSIVVTCTGVCGPAKGSGTTVITYADGSTDNGDWTYEDAAPPPS